MGWDWEGAGTRRERKEIVQVAPVQSESKSVLGGPAAHEGKEQRDIAVGYKLQCVI